MSVVRRRAEFGAGVLLAVAYGGAQLMGRTSGSTRAERSRTFPGDDLVAHPTVVTDHAVTVDAPPGAVWPWLTQMGWHRAGWYTPRWVDLVFFPANRPSSETLEGTLVRDLSAGDTIPDGEPGTAFFVVEQASAPHLLVLHSTTHLPRSWQVRWGAGIDWTWTFVLAEPELGQTRIHLRVRARTWPWWLTLAYVGVLVPADAVMATGMLRGIRRRVEAVRGDERPRGAGPVRGSGRRLPSPE